MDKEKVKKIITTLVQKQMVILGPNVALGKARKIPGLTVGDDGSIKSIKGDPQKALQTIINEYVALSGEITRTIVESISNK